MEFISGVREKEGLGIQEVISGDHEGRTVRMNGTVHTIRHMGEVAFVILRKAEGLVQCVCEGAAGDVDIKDLKEECAVEVKGAVRKEERAPHGFEIRLEDIRILSRPADTMPIPVNKWKLNTSLETNLALRPISLRNISEPA
ncbi:MAG: OB-fold nucleic acid binding domain-containing protein [Clostridiales bacterium]|nr:OB-fold nucleic acid binding domain-containing protein [Clostridiales bacterium]